MVGLGGLEPPASPLSGVRSNHLSYRPVAASTAASRRPHATAARPGIAFGGADRDRTDDPLLSYSPGTGPRRRRRLLWMQVPCVGVLRG